MIVKLNTADRDLCVEIAELRQENNYYEPRKSRGLFVEHYYFATICEFAIRRYLQLERKLNSLESDSMIDVRLFSKIRPLLSIEIACLHTRDLRVGIEIPATQGAATSPDCYVLAQVEAPHVVRMVGWTDYARAALLGNVRSYELRSGKREMLALSRADLWPIDSLVDAPDFLGTTGDPGIHHGSSVS